MFYLNWEYFYPSNPVNENCRYLLDVFKKYIYKNYKACHKNCIHVVVITHVPLINLFCFFCLLLTDAQSLLVDFVVTFAELLNFIFHIFHKTA